MTRTSSVHGLAIGPGPGQLRDGHSDGPTAQQDIVPDGATDPRDGRVHTGNLTLAEFCVGKEDSRQALRFGTAQTCVDERHRGGRKLLELHQIKQTTVALPGVVMKTCVKNRHFRQCFSIR